MVQSIVESLFHVTNCNYRSQSDASPPTDSVTHGWQYVGILGRPCSFVLVVVCVVQLLFLSAYATSICIKKRKAGRSRSSPTSQTSWIEKSTVSVGCLHKLTIVVGIYLCVCHTIVIGWTAFSVLEKGWHHFFFVGLTASFQTSACLIIPISVLKTRAEGIFLYSLLLRVWWIFSFSMEILVFGSKIVTPEGSNLMGLQFDGWIDLLTLPAYMYVSVIAIYGRTSVKRSDDAYVPLLNGYTPSKEPVNYTDYATASVFSLSTFSWLNSLLATGYEKPLKFEDVPQLTGKDTAASSYHLLRSYWLISESKSLVKCLALSFWREAAVNACFAGICVCASYVGPYLVYDFVECLAGRQRFTHEGYLLACLFFTAKLIENMTQRQRSFGAQQLRLRVIAGLCEMLYEKGLSLSNQSRQNHSSGEIVNYVTVDVQRLSDFCWYLHDLWLLPVQISLALFILYKNIGIAALATLGTTAIIMLANIPLSTSLEKSQTDIMQAKDARMRMTSEILRSMRIVKLQAWDMKYFKKIGDLRNVEYRWIKTFLYIYAGMITFFWWTPAIVAVVTFGVCVYIGVPLTTGRVLSALTTFEILQGPICNIPDLVGMLAETKVSVQRLEKFLQEQEMDHQAVDYSVVPGQSCQMVVEIHGACFSWNSTFEKPSLIVKGLQITRGSRIAICGQVGSGKSSLISCILGELPKVSGTVKVIGSKAYVSQSAWTQSGTVQDNILFGKPLDRKKYDHILEICSLKKDLEQFQHGDQTELGERGVNLSGGQKQRIQLARALYEDADIYLLDDPFSAVDAHTGSHLFQKCVLEWLQGKTVIYVTHQVEFLPAADNILVLENGEIVESGRFDELVSSGVHLCKLIGAHAQALESIEDTEPQFSSTLKGKTGTQDREPQKDKHELNMNEDLDNIMDSTNKKQFSQNEERETGRVSLKIYWSLATTVYKGSLVPLLLLAEVFFQSLRIASSYWMAWATPANIDEHPRVTRKVLLIVFSVLALGSAICILTRALLVATVSLKTAQKFFTKMLCSIFHAPMSFFDTTPAGRILSRMSTDQSALDLEVFNIFAGIGTKIIQLTGIVVVMSQSSWIIFVLFIPMLAIALWLQKYYITSSRELSRLAGIRRAPIIHHLTESIGGASIIRGFAQETRFINTNLQLIDDYCKIAFHNFSAMQWLCLRLNLLSTTVFSLSVLLVVSFPIGFFDAGVAGLVVTYGLNLNYVQAAIILCLCQLENKIISVERILQYTHIPCEAPLVVENCRPPLDWPQKGTITLDNLQVRYSLHMPMVLRGITCTFLGGQKIGVVGRTGSGKSTLIQALFRIIEPVGGKVIIDNIDIAQIGLHDLRSKLGIIPQDPTLFEGTVRNNLDPLQEHTDADIWKALDKCQLGDLVRLKNEKLDASVSENGENWSVGQRQLFCLGRALLKRSRIVVLDEATASVDTATDNVIQETIRSEFTECTVITIAHRIPTIIDCDNILYLRDGQVAEYDSPCRLLGDASSLFSGLVMEYTRRSIT